MELVSDEFEKTRDSVQSMDDQTYALFDSAFGKGSCIDAWRTAFACLHPVLNEHSCTLPIVEGYP